MTIIVRIAERRIAATAVVGPPIRCRREWERTGKEKIILLSKSALTPSLD